MLVTSPHHVKLGPTAPPNRPAPRSPRGNRTAPGPTQIPPSGHPTSLRSPSLRSRPLVPTYAGPGLSDREVTVLKAWLGCDSKLGVGTELHIALGTVNTHLTRIRDKYAKVGRPAPTKAALVARALQDGIVTLEEL